MEIACFVCSHVFADVKPVLLVAREGGEWMFMCGDAHASDENYHLVGMRHLLDRDGTLRELLDLGDGMQAERTASHHRWRRSRVVDD